MQARMAVRAHLAFQHARPAGADELQQVGALAFECVRVEQLGQVFAGNILAEAAHQGGTRKPALEIRAIVHRFIKDQAAQQRRQCAGRNILADHEAALFRALHPMVEKVAGIVMGGLAHHRVALVEPGGGVVHFGPNMSQRLHNVSFHMASLIRISRRCAVISNAEVRFSFPAF